MIVRYKVRPEIELGTEELGEEEIEIAEPVFSAVPDEHSSTVATGATAEVKTARRLPTTRPLRERMACTER